MIIEKSVKGIDNKAIIVKKKDVPQSTNKALPNLFNTQLYIGSKGTGKTYKLVQLLKMYEKLPIKDKTGQEYEMRTIAICPTAYSGANEIYKTLTSLKQEDIHLEYTDELFISILDDIKAKIDEFDEYLIYKELYKKFLKIKSLEQLTTEELEILEGNDYKSPDDVYQGIKPIITFIIFDDLIGMGAFNNKAKSVISNLTIKHRHLRVNLIFTTQSFKKIPPVIRTNIDIYVIVKSSSYNEILNKIYEDISGYLTLDNFIELYEYATEEKNDALIIVNNSLDKNGLAYYKNWDIQLFIE